MNTRAEVDAFLDRVPESVLPVVDQAYFEYVSDPDYPDVVADHFRRGRRVLVLRTFSKIFGLAGLRVGYAVGPRDVCDAMAKLRRPFDISTTAQAAALASLEDPAEVDRRRLLNAQGLADLAHILAGHGFEPVAGAVGNFVYVDLGEVASPVFEQLLMEGVIVRPLVSFGAPTAIRVSVGAHDELEFLDAALARIGAAAR
jgi:histidinol-phosphate aminotransferase